jgi:hypothetical protein
MNSKLDKKLRLQFLKDSNRIKSAFSFKQIATWYDLYIQMGYTDEEIKHKYRPAEYSLPITFAEVKDYLEGERLSLEVSIYLRNNPPDLSDLKAQEIKSAILLEEDNELKRFKEDLDQDYGLVTSSNEKVFLFWFQKLATKRLLDGILGFDTNIAKTTDELRDYINKNKTKPV